MVPPKSSGESGDEEDSFRLAFEDPAFLWRDEMRPMRLAAEFAKPELMLRDWLIRSTVIFFGSARPEAPGLPAGIAAEAEALAERVAGYSEAAFEASGRKVRDYVVCTGGGPGLMEAANRGAAKAGAPSIGLNIQLPHEQRPNRYVTPGLGFQFQYFALRKMHFLLRARALAIFPGGFGTLDELFDALTLMQTGKMQPIPILMFGRAYWRRIIDFEALAAAGTIDARDLELLQWVETAEEGWRLLAARDDLDHSRPPPD